MLGPGSRRRNKAAPPLESRDGGFNLTEKEKGLTSNPPVGILLYLDFYI
jgi:hypothetical protein